MPEGRSAVDATRKMRKTIENKNDELLYYYYHRVYFGFQKDARCVSEMFTQIPDK